MVLPNWLERVFRWEFEAYTQDKEEISLLVRSKIGYKKNNYVLVWIMGIILTILRNPFKHLTTNTVFIYVGLYLSLVNECDKLNISLIWFWSFAGIYWGMWCSLRASSLGGGGAIEGKMERELAPTSQEFEFHPQHSCGKLPVVWAVRFWPISTNQKM